ncbi:MAG: outer membrane lipoprotein-sorting protein [Myxococcota bacterium]
MRVAMVAWALGWGGMAITGLVCPEVALAGEVSVDAVLDGVDKNLTFDSRTSTVKMTVEAAKRTREYQLQTMGRGTTESAVEYLAPARDKGTKMLRKGDELWMFMPSVERTQKISGHTLRQGVMGSDMSYEDLTSASKLRETYTATLLREEARDGKDCWVLELKAKDEGATYARRVAWVDKATYVPVQQELYAVSGMLLKTWEMADVKQVDGRHVPMKMVIADQVKKGSTTTVEMSEVAFGVPLEEEVFSQRWLER